MAQRELIDVDGTDDIDYEAPRRSWPPWRGWLIAGCEASGADLMRPAAQHATSGSSASTSPAATPSTAPRTRMAPLTGLPAPVPAPRAGPRSPCRCPAASRRASRSADVVFEEMTSPLRYVARIPVPRRRSVGPVTGNPAHGRAGAVGAAPARRPTTAAPRPSSGSWTSPQVLDLGYASHPSLYHPGCPGTRPCRRARSGSRPGTPRRRSCSPIRARGWPGSAELRQYRSVADLQPEDHRSRPGHPDLDVRRAQPPLAAGVRRPARAGGQRRGSARPVQDRVPEPQVRPHHDQRPGHRLRLRADAVGDGPGRREPARRSKAPGPSQASTT